MTVVRRRCARSQMHRSAQVLSLLLLASLGLVVTALIFSHLRTLEQRGIHEDFVASAARRADSCLRDFKDRLFVIDSLRILCTESDPIVRDEFRKFTGLYLPNFADARALLWVPRVAATERQHYEQQARRDGVEGFQFTVDQGAAVARAPQGDDDYLPIYYVEPHYGNEALMGYDLAADATWRPRLDQAGEAGQSRAYFEGIRTHATSEQTLLTIIQPIYRYEDLLFSPTNSQEDLKGHLIGIFDLKRLLVSQPKLLSGDGIDLELIANRKGQTLWRWPVEGKAPQPSERSKQSAHSGSLVYERAFRLAGRQLTLRCIASQRSLRERRFMASKPTLIGGVLLTCLLTLKLKGYLEKTERITRLVEKRTQELAQSRAALEDRNSFLNHVLASLAHPLYVVDADDFTIQLTNQTLDPDPDGHDVTCYQAILSRDELCQKTDWPCVVRKVKDLGQSCTMDFVTTDQSGRQRFLEVHGYPIFDDEHKVSQVIEYHIDRTERARAEEARREQNEELAAIYANAPLIMMLVDGGRRIRKVNRFALKFSGLSETDVVGRTGGSALGCIHALESPGGCGTSNSCCDCAVRRTVEETLTTGRAHSQVEVRSEFTIRGKKCEYVFLLSTGRVRVQTEWMVLVSLLDITERKQTGERVAEQLTFTETLLDTLPTPVYYKDREGRYLGCNHAFAEFVGAATSEIVGRTVYDIAPTELAETYQRQDQALFESPGTQHYEWQVRNAQGQVREVMFDKGTFRDASGQVAGLIGVISDITERKQAEDDVRQQKELLSRIISIIPAFVFWKDTHSVYLGCNEAFAHSAGLDSPEAIVGKTDYDLVWKSDADFHRDCDHEVLRSGRPLLNIEECQTRADGSQITLLTSKVPLKDQSGNVVGVLGIYSDISDRKRVEEENAILARFPAENPSPVLRAHTDGTVFYANRASGPLLDFLGIVVGDTLPSEWTRVVGEAARTGIVGREELSCDDKTYSITLAPISERRYVNIYALDITGRKLAEEAIEQHRLFLKIVLDSFAGNVAVLDSEGRITMVNQAWTQFGVDNGLAEGLTFEEVDYPALCRRAAGPNSEGANEAADGIERVLSEPGSCFTMEYPCHGPDAKRWFQLRADPFEFQGRSWAVIAHIDITERKLAEERQRALLEEVEDINAQLRDFAHIVSHDLKAPLRGIRTLADWIVSDFGDRLGDEGKEQLELLIGRVERMHNLINGILEYSRVSRNQGPLKSVDLHECVANVIESLVPPSHISITIDDTLPTLPAEPTRMVQLFQNLLSNAIKYMDKDEGRIHIGCADEAGSWRFWISDTGPGIPECHFERIFQIFQTLTPRDVCESTGVGLAVVKRIVELHGGTIWVESQVDKGSTFYFTLPKRSPRITNERDETTAVTC